MGFGNLCMQSNLRRLRKTHSMESKAIGEYFEVYNGNEAYNDSGKYF